MPKSTFNSDFSDVNGYFKQARELVRREMERTGREAVAYAKEHGNYRDRTGVLRQANRYTVTEDVLTLRNDTDYAADVEAKGYDVLSGAALFAEQRLKETFE